MYHVKFTKTKPDSGKTQNSLSYILKTALNFSNIGFTFVCVCVCVCVCVSVCPQDVLVLQVEMDHQVQQESKAPKVSQPEAFKI